MSLSLAMSQRKNHIVWEAGHFQRRFQKKLFALCIVACKRFIVDLRENLLEGEPS